MIQPRLGPVTSILLVQLLTCSLQIATLMFAGHIRARLVKKLHLISRASPFRCELENTKNSELGLTETEWAESFSIFGVPRDPKMSPSSESLVICDQTYIGSVQPAE
jgi:hypothetical protein